MHACLSNPMRKPSLIPCSIYKDNALSGWLDKSRCQTGNFSGVVISTAEGGMDCVLDIGLHAFKASSC